MANEEFLPYVDAKNRIVRALSRVTTFVKASAEYNSDRQSMGKRAKIKNMLQELKEIRKNVESDIQLMESAVAKGSVPLEVNDNTCSSSLIDSFDTLYYELAAFADVHEFSLSPKLDDSTNITAVSNQSSGPPNNLSCFQFPKRKFPTFSGRVLLTGRASRICSIQFYLMLRNYQELKNLSI